MPIRDLTRSERAKFALRIVLGAYVAFSALNAQAAPASAPSTDRVSPAFGNTVLTTYPDGRHQRIWLHEDGSWDGVSRRGHQTAGRWSVKGDKVCLRQSKPVPLPMSYCAEFPDAAAPGVEWTGKDATGTPIKLTLQKGMVKP